MPNRSQPATTIALRSLRDPRTLAAISLLLLNDHLLKTHYPGLVTGKLSDFAGLVFFPLLMAAIIGMVIRRPGTAIAVGVSITGLWFIAIKTLPVAAGATESVAEVFIGRSQIVVDPWDLVALPALAYSVMIFNRAIVATPASRIRRIPLRRKAELAALAIAAFASLASSCDEGDGVTDIDIDATGDTATAWIEGYRMVSSDGFDTFESGYDSPNEDSDDRVLEACLPDGTCFRIDGGPYVLESRDGASWTIAWEIPEGRLDFLKRYESGCGRYFVRSWDIGVTTGEDPVVLVAMGHDGILRRQSDGTWERGLLPWSRPLAEIGTNISGELIAVAVAGLLIAMGTAFIARSKLAGGDAAKAGPWTIAAFGVLGIGLIRMLGEDLADSNLYALFGLGAILPALIGLAGITSLWSKLGRLRPGTARRLSLAANGTILLGTLGMAAPFLAWSSGDIPRLETANLVAGIILGILLITLATILLRWPGSGASLAETSVLPPQQGNDGTPPEAPKDITTDAGDAGDAGDADTPRPEHPWLAALVLSILASALYAYSGFAVILALVATYLAARWTNHEAPASRMFLAMAAAVAGFAGSISVAGSVWAVTVVSVRPPTRTAWVLRIVVLVGGGALVWFNLRTLGGQIVSPPSPGLDMPISIATLSPFLIVAGDRLTEWWESHRRGQQAAA